MEIENKSPNKIWRESGTSLSFADWIQREKDKGAFLANKKFENFANINGISDYTQWLEQIKQQNRIKLGIDKPTDSKKANDNTFIGLNKTLLLISGLIVIGAIGYKIYQKNK